MTVRRLTECALHVSPLLFYVFFVTYNQSQHIVQQLNSKEW